MQETTHYVPFETFCESIGGKFFKSKEVKYKGRYGYRKDIEICTFNEPKNDIEVTLIKIGKRRSLVYSDAKIIYDSKQTNVENKVVDIYFNEDNLKDVHGGCRIFKGRMNERIIICKTDYDFDEVTKIKKERIGDRTVISFL